MRAGTANAMRDVLRQVAWPENHAKVSPAAQGNPCRVFRLTLGLVSARGQGPAVSQVTLGRPNLLRLLVWWLSKWEPDAVCTSIAVAASAEAGIHCDHPNLIDTWVQVFCTCSGGALWIHDDGWRRQDAEDGGGTASPFQCAAAAQDLPSEVALVGHEGDSDILCSLYCRRADAEEQAKTARGHRSSTAIVYENASAYE